MEQDHCAGYWSRYRSARLEFGLDDFDYLKPGDGGRPCIIDNSPVGRLCGMEGGKEVVLLYWPPELEARNICAANGQGTAFTKGYQNLISPFVVTTSAITFSGLGIEEFSSDGRLAEYPNTNPYSGEGGLYSILPNLVSVIFFAYIL